MNTVLDRNKGRVLPSFSNAQDLANKMNSFFINKIKTIRNHIPHEDGLLVSTPFSGTVLNSFHTVNCAELKDIISEFGIKTSEIDPLPAKLLSLYRYPVVALL